MSNKELFRVPQDAIPMVKRFSKKDVMLHCACTIMNTTDSVEIVGEKEQEICQFAVHIPGKLIPKPESHIRRAFQEMCELTLEKMRASGLIK